MATQIQFFLDGVEVTAIDGETILEVAKRMGKDIPTLCHDPRLTPFTSCYVCLVEQEGKAGFVPSCGTKVAPGIKIRTDSPDIRAARKMCLELLMSAHVGDCVAPCRLKCPGNLDIQTYIAAIAASEFGEALSIIKRTNPFPSVCGRVCPHTCELQCRRNRVDQPVAINPLKRFVADLDLSQKQPYQPPVAADTGKKVAIIGAGPAGLTCAYFLRQKGHFVSVFEKNAKAGGMLRYGIPRYRLPDDTLDLEIKQILSLGVDLQLGKTLGRDFTLASLKQQGFEVVFLAVGAWTSSKMDVPGEELPGVLPGIHFLFDVASGKRPDIGSKVVVLGGGNTAIDAARTSKRLGADVTILYRRTRKEMPAESYEVDEAEREGIKMHFLAAPVALLEKNGRARGIKAIRMELGEPDASGRRKPVAIPGSEFEVAADTIIAAIGQKPDNKVWQEDGAPGATKWATVKADEKTYQSEVPWVFSAGDCLTGAATAIEAISGGRKAAISIDRYLRKLPLLPIGKPFSDIIGRLEDMDDDFFVGIEKTTRAKTCELPIEKRCENFAEVDLGIAEAQALAEASRCLECGCTAVDSCTFRKLCEEYDIKPDTFKSDFKFKKVLEDHPFIKYDPNKCIVCGRCVRICLEQQGIGALGFVHRGFETLIQPTLEKPLLQTDCDSCGQCLGTCPTGALEAKRVLPKPGPFFPKCTPAACGFCGLACKLNLETSGGRYLRASVEPGAGHNRGNLCVDGAFGHRYLETITRLVKPRIKEKNKSKEASWEQALSAAASGLKKSRESGKEVVVLVNGPLCNEDAYLLQRWSRTTLKTNHILSLDGADDPSSLSQILSGDSHQASLADLSESDLIWMVGEDPFESAPVAGIEIHKAAKAGVPLWLFASKTTRLDEIASRVVRVATGKLEPLFAALYEYGKAEKEATLLNAASSLGLKPAFLNEALALLRGAKRPIIVCGDSLPGQAIENLFGLVQGVAAAGKTMILFGGGNGRGRQIMGIHPTRLPGEMALDDKAGRGRFEKSYGTALSPTPGMNRDEVFKAIKAGQVGGVLLVNTDPCGLDLDVKDFKRGVFLVVVDLAPGALEARADVLLPAASLAETTGTLITVEDQIVATEAAREPACGKSLFAVLSGLAQASGQPFPFDSPPAVWTEISKLVPRFSKYKPSVG